METKHEENVRLTVDSGVAPLELIFFPITDCGEGNAFAYRTETVINSITHGRLRAADYTTVSDRQEWCKRVLLQSLHHVKKAMCKLKAAGRKVEFLSVRCPTELVQKEDLHGLLSEYLAANPDFDPQTLCLTFSSSLLDEEEEKVRTTVLDMKILKIRTAVTGCGAASFPLSKLLEIPVNYAVLNRETTSIADSRNKPQYVGSLIGYLRSMFIEVIAEGAEQYRKPLRRTDCLGFIDADETGKTFEEIEKEEVRE